MEITISNRRFGIESELYIDCSNEGMYLSIYGQDDCPAISLNPEEVNELIDKLIQYRNQLNKEGTNNG